MKLIYDPILDGMKIAPLSNFSKLSSIVDSDMALKIKNFFPAEKQSSIVKRIYKGSRDGWELSVF